MNDIRVGDKVQVTKPLEGNEHLRNKTGFVKRSVGLPDDVVMVKIGSMMPFEKRELTKVS